MKDSVGAAASARRTERPILFSAPMVRALLAGTKTQTRRVVKRAPHWATEYEPVIVHGELCFGQRGRAGTTNETFNFFIGEEGEEPPIRCPYGMAGDTLWVRETWGAGNRPCSSQGWVDGIEYRADCTDDCAPPLYDIIPADVEADSIRPGWRPSIHMPRWASRITLQITDVRVERLNDISEADADAECFGGDYPDRVLPEVFPYREEGWGHLSIAECYGRLWDHINGEGAWAANPWVWAVSFARAPSPASELIGETGGEG